MEKHADRLCLRVGGRHVRFEQARVWVDEYVAQDSSSAYGVYDHYRQQARFARLDEADLLAPVLLNVSPFTLKAFRWLSEQIGTLNSALDAIPHEANLADHGSDLALLGPLFAVLDGQREKVGVRTTILAKVLHRKRPGFIPLWDRRVRRCYMESTPCRIVVNHACPYSQFIQKIGAAIREDLQADPTVWKELATLAPRSVPALTELRALDIVAWKLGGRDGAAACGEHLPA